MFIGYAPPGKHDTKFITWTSMELAIRFAREEDARNLAEALSRLVPRLGIQHGNLINEHSWSKDGTNQVAEEKRA